MTYFHPLRYFGEDAKSIGDNDYRDGLRNMGVLFHSDCPSRKTSPVTEKT